MTSSTKIDNKKKYILILGKGPTQRLGEHSLTTEKMYSTNFTKNFTKFCFNLHYNEENTYLFVNGTEIHIFKAENSEIEPKILCLGNVSTDFPAGNMNKIGYNGYIYRFLY